MLLKKTSFSSTSWSHLFCCRFLNHTGRHHILHEAKQLWQQRSVRSLKSYLRYELNEAFLRKLLIYFVVAGYLLRMEPSGRLLALSSPSLRYVLEIWGIKKIKKQNIILFHISLYYLMRQNVSFLSFLRSEVLCYFYQSNLSGKLEKNCENSPSIGLVDCATWESPRSPANLS